MMTFNTDKFKTPQALFIIYVIACSLVLMIFRFIFPGSEAPLIIYSRNWRFIQGILEIFNWFPAIAFSALVIPFGLASYEENYGSFSDLFFKKIVPSIIIGISAAVIYGFIFFFALPVVKNNVENLRFTGEMYQLAKKNIYESMEKGEWNEAAQFLNICDRIWNNSPELAEPRDRIAINLNRQFYEAFTDRAAARAALTGEWRDLEEFDEIQQRYALSEHDPIDATEAISMSMTALDDRRYFDAHWLANLGARLAPSGSVQQAYARRIASEAWNMIASQAPSRTEERLLELHNMKLSGFNAMMSGRYIDAFYIFSELITLTPDDPDVANYLERSERGAVHTAFFIDEINMSVGEIINGPLFSLPIADGRAVLRFSLFKTLTDVAYGIGLEYMRFDQYNNLIANAVSGYAKLLPITVDGKPQMIVLTHALDRENKDRGSISEWSIGSEYAGGILLGISFDDFLLLTNVRRGLANLQVSELFQAAKKLETAGYSSEIFQAEILNRFVTALFFLPMTIFTLVIAWRLRAKTKPRYLFFVLLPVLPIVFNGLVFLYRTVFNTLGIWLVVNIGFIPALTVFIVGFGALLFVSLISLTAQKN